MMTSRQRLLAIVIGVLGAIGSCIALAVFLARFRSNGLVPPEAATAQAFYQSVGRAYSGGFAAGFSLCFFLTLLAVAIGTWFDARRVELLGKQTEPILIPMVRSDPH
jgi:hypothetical protein